MASGDPEPPAGPESWLPGAPVGDGAAGAAGIDERDVARHVARRGRRHAYPELDPAATALVVVDLVAFFVAGSEWCGSVVPHVNALAASLRTRGGTVAWVVPAVGAPSDWAVEFYGAATAVAYAGSGGRRPAAARGAPQH